MFCRVGNEDSTVGKSEELADGTEGGKPGFTLSLKWEVFCKRQVANPVLFVHPHRHRSATSHFTQRQEHLLSPAFIWNLRRKRKKTLPSSLIDSLLSKRLDSRLSLAVWSEFYCKTEGLLLCPRLCAFLRDRFLSKSPLIKGTHFQFKLCCPSKNIHPHIVSNFSSYAAIMQQLFHGDTAAVAFTHASVRFF